MMCAELKLNTTGRNIPSPTHLQVDHREKTLPAEEWNEIKGKYFAFDSYIINPSWRSEEKDFVF